MKRRWWWWAGGGCALLAIACVAAPGTWLVMHLVGEPGPPLFTEEDLPPPPPGDQDGWFLAVEGARDLELPGEAMTDPRASIEERLASFDAMGPTLAAFDEAHEELDLTTRVLDRPRFVGRCAGRDEDAACPNRLDVLATLRLLLLRSALAAHDGRWDDAVAISLGVLERAADALRNAVWLIDAAVAVLVLRGAIAYAEVLVQRAPDPTALHVGVAALARSPLFEPQRMVRGEYVQGRADLDAVRASGEVPLADWERVTRLHDERARAWDAYVRGDGPAPSDRELSWLDEQQGDALVEIIEIRGFGERLAAIEEDADAARESLRALGR